jgi:hypothetical protein
MRAYKIAFLPMSLIAAFTVYSGCKTNSESASDMQSRAPRAPRPPASSEAPVSDLVTTYFDIKDRAAIEFAKILSGTKEKQKAFATTDKNFSISCQVKIEGSNCRFTARVKSGGNYGVNPPDGGRRHWHTLIGTSANELYGALDLQEEIVGSSIKIKNFESSDGNLRITCEMVGTRNQKCQIFKSLSL